MHPALAQVSTLNTPFEKDVEDYAAGKCTAIELWWGKLDAYLSTKKVADVRRHLERHQMTAPVVSFQGGLLISQGEARHEAWRTFARRLGLARELGVATLVISDPLHGGAGERDVERFRHSLREAADEAARAGIRLALEFHARSLFCNNLQTAVAIVQEIGNPHLGICLDAFHFEVGPSKSVDLQLLSQENLFHVQFCDVADTPREVASDSDRVLPGDGDIDLGTIVKRLREMEYAGYVSVELMNPRVFQVPARSFGEIAMTALRKVLGQASMDD